MEIGTPHLFLDSPPRVDESLNGLLVRLAGVNFLQSMSSLEKLANLSVPRIALEDGGLEELARLSGLSLEALQWRQYGPSGSGILRRFFGHEVHPYRLRTTDFRYCPVCMGQTGYHKAVWELDLVQTCPAHREMLITTDPVTLRSLTWHRVDLLEASVGDLPTSDGYREKSRDEADDAFRGQELLYEFLGLGRFGRTPVLAVLGEQLDLNELFKLLLFLGGEFNESAVSVGTKRVPREDRVILDTTNVGYDLLLDWPAAFHDRLDRIRREYSGSRFGLSRVFNSLFRRMSKMEDGTAKTILQRAITDFLSDQPVPFNPKNVHFVRGQEWVERSYVTLQQATQLLEVTQYRGRQIAISEGWIDPDKTDRHTQNLIPRELVLNYVAPAKEYYTKKELYSALGITRSAYPSLIKSRLITPLADAPDGRMTYVFAKQEVDSLVERLVAAASVVSSQPGEDRDLEVRGLLPRFGQPTVSIGRLLTLVLAGVVDVDRYDPTQRGLYGLRFAEHKIPQIRTRVRRVGSFSVSGRMALRRICLDREFLERGVQRGRVRITETGVDFEKSRLHLGDLLSYVETRP